MKHVLHLLYVGHAARNLTIKLDASVIQRAKLIAARRGVSVSKLLVTELERLAKEDLAYELAREKAMRLLDDARDLGSGGKLSPRDELHER